ncbi:MAG: TetR/AcrR family transcriptional regulator [Vagococcus sp.]|uniref:TetR/AcrR family transcriptional regulator n=1 Tax=Vagococcus sp. TaxID=1933889 RepID=UPI002FC74895
MGVREDKKRKLQEKIITAARELFLEKEFDQVTMNQIAKRADVGLGTAYNYYASKEELYLVAGGTAFVFGENFEKELRSQTIDQLIDAIMTELKSLAKIEKESWRTSLSSLTKAAEKKPTLFLELVAIDHLFISKLKQTIEELQNQQEINSAVDSVVLLELIYSAMFTSFLFFIYNDQMTFDSLEKEIRAKLNQLLKK